LSITYKNICRAEYRAFFGAYVVIFAPVEWIGLLA
jgi:hypothetical protein